MRESTGEKKRDHESEVDESEREMGAFKKKEKETPVAHFTDDALFAYINLLARNGNCNGRISSISFDEKTEKHTYDYRNGRKKLIYTHMGRERAREIWRYGHTHTHTH